MKSGAFFLGKIKKITKFSTIELKFFTHNSMRLLYKKSQKSKMDFYPINPSTVSTLLIPKNLLEQMEERFGTNYKMYGVLKFLLLKYRKFIASGQILGSKKFKLRYQEKGLDLVRKRFRPYEKSWAELGILSYGLGSSRCWLFSYLLELEFSLLGEFLALPEMVDAHTTLTNSTPKNILQFTERNTAFQRVLHFRE